MENQREQSKSIEEPSTIDSNAQLNVQFNDGKLTHISLANESLMGRLNANPGVLHPTTKKLSLADEPTITNENIYFHNGELHLTAENMSLIDEIKILIRKLWN